MGPGSRRVAGAHFAATRASKAGDREYWNQNKSAGLSHSMAAVRGNPEFSSRSASQPVRSFGNDHREYPKGAADAPGSENLPGVLAIEYAAKI
jgi:hypothetical protein